MAKAKARRIAKAHTIQRQVAVEASSPASTTSVRRATPTRGTRRAQSLVMPVMVALGCWGMAFSFIFLTAEANHYLFGAIAAIMALMWSFSVAMRIRQVQRQKP